MCYKLPSEKIRRTIIFRADSKTAKSEVTDSALMLRRIVQPVGNAVAHLGKIWVSEGLCEDDSVIPAICDGWDLAMPGVLKFTSGIEEGDLTAVMTENDELIALGEAKLSSGKMRGQEKAIAVRVRKAFIKKREEKLE